MFALPGELEILLQGKIEVIHPRISEIAKAFLDAGIHVICDKPLTSTVEDALDLARRVKTTGLIFGVTLHRLSHGEAGSHHGSRRRTRCRACNSSRVRPRLAHDSARTHRPEAGRLADPSGTQWPGRELLTIAFLLSARHSVAMASLPCRYRIHAQPCKPASEAQSPGIELDRCTAMERWCGLFDCADLGLMLSSGHSSSTHFYD